MRNIAIVSSPDAVIQKEDCTFGFVLRVFLSDFIEPLSFLMRRLAKQNAVRCRYSASRGQIHLDLLQRLCRLRMLLTQDMSDVDSSSGFQAAFTLLTQRKFQELIERRLTRETFNKSRSMSICAPWTVSLQTCHHLLKRRPCPLSCHPYSCHLYSEFSLPY